jgi:hypothetical protein
VRTSTPQRHLAAASPSLTSEEEHSIYSSVVSVMYLYLVTSLPDQSFAVSILSAKTQGHAPTESDWTALKRAARCLRGTHDLGMVAFKGTGHLWAYGYADVSFAAQPDARSHSSLMLCLSANSALAHFMSSASWYMRPRLSTSSRTIWPPFTWRIRTAA